MNRYLLPIALAALVPFSPPPPLRPPLPLRVATLRIEYDAQADEAVLVASAEGESALDELELRDPQGNLQLRFSGGLASLLVDREGEDLARFLGECPAGLWQLRGITAEGTPVIGSALLSHALAPEPALLTPTPGALDVPSTALLVSWTHDPAAVGHHVSLERGETDLLAAELGAEQDSFLIPAGMLAPQTRYWLELGARGPGGNLTTVRFPFRTR